MSMVTQCPNCDTLFRVTPQQLQKRQGRVRCGRCLEVFDGFHSLSAEPERVRVEHIEEAASGPEDDIARAEAAAAARTREDETIRESSRAPLREWDDEPAPAAEHAASDSFAMNSPPWQKQEDVPAVHRSRAATTFAAGSAVLLMILVAQAIYAYRVDLAAHFAGLRPLRVRWCAAAGCAMPLPQRPQLISIEASDLQAIDPTRPGLIKLTATLRSHASYDLGFPALDLVLTNAQDHTLARRIFLPQEYVDAKRDFQAGLPPSAEVTVQLELDAAELGASGFRLDLLPAPAK